MLSPSQMQILLATSAETLEAVRPAFTVEAEYGSTVVQGKLGTLAHHEAARAAGLDSACPCLLAPGSALWGAAAGMIDGPFGPSQVPGEAWPVIGVSHWDWDTAGGVFGLLGVKPVHGVWGKVWQAVAHVDEQGPHRAETFAAYPEVRRQVEAMRAHASANRVTVPRGVAVVDATEEAERDLRFLLALDQELECAGALGLLPGDGPVHLEADLPLLAAGVRFAAEQEDLAWDSFVASYGGGRLLLRASDRFVNQLYRHEGRVAMVIVGFNTATGAVTLSFERPEATAGLSAAALMRQQFGDRAGGHRGIAGSPRGEVRSLAEAEALARTVADLLPPHA